MIANDEILVYLIYYIQVAIVYCTGSLYIYVRIIITTNSCRYEPSLHLTKNIYVPRKISRQISAYGFRQRKILRPRPQLCSASVTRRAIYNILYHGGKIENHLNYTYANARDFSTLHR